MANTILFSKTNQIPLANGGLKLSKVIALDKIEEHPKFKALFSMEESLKDRIKENIKSSGFDASQPLHIWVCEEQGSTHYYLIDGYTRKTALMELGILTCPYFQHDFSTFEEAYRYALHLQVDRRNLSDEELLKNVETLMGTDYIQNIKGSAAEAVAESLGVSKRTVQRAISVNKNATDEQKQRIERGEATVNQIYQENHQNSDSENGNKKSKKSKDEEFEKDTLEDNSGGKAPLNFNHSDGILRPEHPEDSAEQKAFLEEIKSRESLASEMGQKAGFLKGFEIGFLHAIAMAKKGDSLKDILKSIEDFSSPSLAEMYKELPPDEEEIINSIETENL